MEKMSGNNTRGIEDMPLFYSYLKKIDKRDIQKTNNISFINISYYQTDEFVPYPHYKSISKITISDI
jgi:hypothetical protein